MNEQSDNATTASEAPERSRARRLVRSRHDRVLCGVAGGLGAYTRTDPVLWRIGFVVLTLFSGAGLIAYLIMWLVVPSEDGGTATADVRRAAAGTGSRRWIGIAALVAGAAILVHEAWHLRGGLVIGLLLIGAGVALWTREIPPTGAERSDRDDSPDPDEVEGGPEAAEPAGADGEDDLPATTPSRPRRRRRSALGRLALGSAALVAGAGLLLDELGVLEVTAEVLVAAVLVVLGSGLVVGAWWGRARWLVFPGLGLVLALASLASAPYTVAAFSDGAGARHISPEATTDLRPEYRLGFGELVLDLSDLDFGTRMRRVEARVGFGELGVVVPPDVAVEVSGRVGTGEIELFGESQGGLGVTAVTRREGDAGPLVLDLDVGFGQITVARAGTPEALSILADHDWRND